MKDEKEIEVKDYEPECVKAIPGPAIVITKEQYERMQSDNEAGKNKERLESVVKKLNIVKKEDERNL